MSTRQDFTNSTFPPFPVRNLVLFLLFRISAFHLLLEESHREQHLGQGALHDIIPSRPAIQNQAFPKKCVEENERRRENDFSADAIGPAEVGEGGCKQVLGMAGRMTRVVAE